jgi:hypothetical protein
MTQLRIVARMLIKSKYVFAFVSYLPPDIMKIRPFANLRVRLNVNISIAILLDLLN